MRICFESDRASARFGGTEFCRYAMLVASASTRAFSRGGASSSCTRRVAQQRHGLLRRPLCVAHSAALAPRKTRNRKIIHEKNIKIRATETATPQPFRFMQDFSQMEQSARTQEPRAWEPRVAAPRRRQGFFTTDKRVLSWVEILTSRRALANSSIEMRIDSQLPSLPYAGLRRAGARSRGGCGEGERGTA